ncbi:MAG: energy-coupling factor transporter transmembrane component T, partial [Candidatus Latescibacterota bacterium]|nr:energy-coupling factor transporter transmembrane component T [Candidatus Latescibacterota bacterium]
LFVSAFSRAERLAEAMEVRGYRGAQGRSRYREPSFRKIDATAFGVCISFSAGSVFMGIN